MNEWQPIETAPKDGTPILVSGGEDDNYKYVTDGDETKMRSPCRVWWSDGDNGCWVITVCEAGYVYVKRDSPTHWMPLPEPTT